MGWDGTAISDRPTTIAPLKAVLIITIDTIIIIITIETVIGIIKIITIVIDITRYEWNARVFSVEEDLRLFKGRNRFYR